MFAAALVGADVVLVNTEFRTDALAGALDRTPDHDDVLRQRICRTDPGCRARRSGSSIRLPSDPAGAASRPSVVASGRLVLLTSGTTGKPKGVPRMPADEFGVGRRMTILDRTRLRVGSRISVAMPMFHGLGLGMLMLTVAWAARR